MKRSSHASRLSTLLVGLALTHVASAQVIRYTVDPMEPLGSSPNSQFALAVQGAGDIDGDGYDDFMVSSSPSSSDPNVARVYSGRSGAILFSIPYATSPGGSGARDGRTLASAGDLDGDGKDDVLIALSGGSHLTHGWQIDAISGATGAVIRSFAHGPYNDESTHAQAHGDVNGDGTPDLLIFQYRSGGTLSINVFLVSGADGVELARLDTSSFDMGQPGSEVRVRSIRDANGDGVRDVIIGTPGHPTSPVNSGGQLRVLSGTNFALIHLVNGPSERIIGQSVGGAGDVNGDGVGDFFAGGYGTNPQIDSAIYFYSGTDASPLHQIEWTLPGHTGYVRVEGLGDMNGDGLDELAVRLLGPLGNSSSIRVYTAATGTELFSMSTSVAGLNFGRALAAAGDINGDGMQDLLIGAPRISGNSQNPAEAYVVSSAPVNGGTLCIGIANSTGQRAKLAATSTSGFTLAGNDVVLNATQMPPGIVGLPIVSRFAGVAIGPGGTQGRLCIWGSTVGRSNSMAFVSSATGTTSLSIDAQALQFGSTPVSAMVGETFNFQLWFRDMVGGTPTANFTDAVTITYL